MPDAGPAYGRTRVGGGYLDRCMDGCTDSLIDYRTSSYTDSCAYFDTDGYADSHADDGCTDSRAYRRTSSYADSCPYSGTHGYSDSHTSDGTKWLRRRPDRRSRRVR